jgi:hypothetical protein
MFSRRSTIEIEKRPFYAAKGISEDDFIKSAVLSSLAMTRPKAKVLWNWQELKWQTNYLLKVLL